MLLILIFVTGCPLADEVRYCSTQSCFSGGKIKIKNEIKFDPIENVQENI